MNDSLSEVPLLEVVSSVFLMSWVDLRCEDHFAHQLSLFKSLVHKQIVLLMHSSVTTLARPLEDLESSPQTVLIK
jgi:hypothetical protein